MYSINSGRVLAACLVLSAGTGVVACGHDAHPAPPGRPAAIGPTAIARDTTIAAVLEAPGVAEPVRKATLSTRLMGAVTDVLVHEGDRVGAGQVLARIDAAELRAQGRQAEARIAEAEAAQRDALANAERYRALFADSAATRVQLEAMETALARAEASLAAARAGRDQLGALGAYAEIRAPFRSVVTRRAVDPGSFVAPGTPIIEVEDASHLRISATVAPTVARSVVPGTRVAATVEGVPASAVVEGAVPGAGTALYTLNALVDNSRSTLANGGAATLLLPQGIRRAIVIPAEAVVREGDLTGVRIAGAQGPELRWVRLGPPVGEDVEVATGLAPGERVLLTPPAQGGGR